MIGSVDKYEAWHHAPVGRLPGIGPGPWNEGDTANGFLTQIVCFCVETKKTKDENRTHGWTSAV